ncbi:MAG: hypothetical protein ACI4MF_09950 [Candidatus Faecivicinus sp.]
MKLLKLLAAALVIVLLSASALADSNFENLVSSIVFHMETDKWMDADREELYLSGGTTKAELCAAIDEALTRTRSNEWISDECKASYQSYLDRCGYISQSTASIQIRDLGDDSVPVYLLCALAALALGGAMFARRKCLSAG